MKRVVLAMSGGVDSSVCALLLKEQGWDVVGVTFQFWRDGAASDAASDAAEVCRTLGIPHRALDLREQFLHAVVTPFQNEYFAGRTPNPCVRCNPIMKFSALMKVAGETGAHAIATGHYVVVEETNGMLAEFASAETRVAIRKAADGGKDQSYVLYGLSQEQLSRCVFPLGGMKKEDVREIARSRGLHVHNRPDSQEICFLPGNDYGAFLARTAPDRIKPGPVVDVRGGEVGRHEGIHKFTIGQRKGLGIAFGEPRFVVRIIPETSTVVVGKREDTMTKSFIVRGLNWVSIAPPEGPFEALTKIRYTHTPVPARIAPLDHGRSALVDFESPVSSVTPGQSAVFYKGDFVLGGGVIDHRNEL